MACLHGLLFIFEARPQPYSVLIGYSFIISDRCREKRFQICIRLKANMVRGLEAEQLLADESRSYARMDHD